MGTSGVVFAHSDEVQVDPEGRLHTFCHAVRGKWHVMGCVLSAGGSLQWFRNQLCQAEVAAAKKQKIDPYELITAEAATARRRNTASPAAPPARRAPQSLPPTPCNINTLAI